LRRSQRRFPAGGEMDFAQIANRFSQNQHITGLIINDQNVRWFGFFIIK
jgi:hypothetical protein